MIASMGGVEAARRVRAGEATDVVVLASNVTAQLEAEGHLRAGSCAGIARSAIAVAVGVGASRRTRIKLNRVGVGPPLG